MIAVAIGVLGVVAANLLLGGDDGTEEAAGDDEPAALEDPSAVQKVTEDMIWIDNYVFYMKDREPAPDPDAKRRKGGLFGM